MNKKDPFWGCVHGAAGHHQEKEPGKEAQKASVPKPEDRPLYSL
jgi:hypothetical protein